MDILPSLLSVHRWWFSTQLLPPEALAVALRVQPFSRTLKPPETEWLSFLLPHEPQEAAFPQLCSAGWASEIELGSKPLVLPEPPP